MIWPNELLANSKLTYWKLKINCRSAKVGRLIAIVWHMLKKHVVASVVNIVFVICFCFYAISPLSFSSDQIARTGSKSIKYSGFRLFALELLLDITRAGEPPLNDATEQSDLFLAFKVRAVIRDCNLLLNRFIEIFCGACLIVFSLHIALTTAIRHALCVIRFYVVDKLNVVRTIRGFHSLASGLSPPFSII